MNLDFSWKTSDPSTEIKNKTVIFIISTTIKIVLEVLVDATRQEKSEISNKEKRVGISYFQRIW